MWLLHVVVMLILWCNGLPLTFTQPEVCRSLQLKGKLSIDGGFDFLFIGESANLHCSINSMLIPNFSPTNFHIKVKKCQDTKDLKTSSLIINDSYVIRVQDPITDIACSQKYLDYYCYYHIKEEDCEVGRKFIYFEYAPSSVTDFSCLVDNWRNMTCEFDMGVTYRQWNLTTFNSVQISVNTGIMGFTDELREDNIRRNGRNITLLISEDYFSLMKYEIKIRVSNTARNESKLSCFEFLPQTFVKPAKISGLVESANATALSLKWSHSNMQMSKLFRVCYTSQWQPHTSSQVCKLTRKNEYSIVLTNLWPYTEYSLTINVKPLFMNGTETGFWSDKTVVTYRTSEDVPFDVPKLWPGFFEQAGDGSVRIYWQPISEKNRCGVLQSYRVTVQDIVPYGEEENITKIDDIPADSISYVITLESKKKYKLKLTQRTVVGFPKNDDAHIFIFPENLRPVLSDLFMVQGLNGTSVEVHWERAYVAIGNQEVTDIFTYHIVWCKNSLEGKCTEPIHAKIFTDENVTSYSQFIELEDGHFTDYRFGITTEGGTRDGWFISSGIRWYQDCIYLKDGVPKSPPQSFEIPQDVEQDNGIYMTWHQYSCRESSGKIDSYLISYCPADGSNVTCTDKVQKVSSNTSSYTLTDIIRGQKYVVKIRAQMEGGKYGPWSKPEKVLYKSQKTVETKKIDFAMIAGIIIGIVGIFCAVFVAVYLRRRCKKSSAELKKIDVPAINLRGNYNSLQTTGDTGESRQPLLNATRDSGIGGSTVNGNSVNSLDKKSGNSHDGVSQIQQNGHVPKHSPVKEYPENTNSRGNSCTETSFSIPHYSDSVESDSDGYSDVDQRSTDYESGDCSSIKHSDSQDSSIHKYPDRKKLPLPETRHGDAENAAFQSENSGRHSEPIDSYCAQGGSSGSVIDSYSKQGEATSVA